MSIGYYGIAHLQDYDYSEQIAIYSFDCIKSGVSCGNSTLSEDGLFTITYELNRMTFKSNKGIIKNKVKCHGNLKIDKPSTNCLQADSIDLTNKFKYQFCSYLENNNGLIPLKLGFTC